MNREALTTIFTQLVADLRDLGPGASGAARGALFDERFGPLVLAIDEAEGIVMSAHARATGLDSLLKRTREKGLNREESFEQEGSFESARRSWLPFGIAAWPRPARLSLAVAGLAVLALLGYLALTWNAQRSQLVAPRAPKVDRQLPGPIEPKRTPPERDAPVVKEGPQKPGPLPQQRRPRETDGAVAVRGPRAGVLEAVSGDPTVLIPGVRQPIQAKPGLAIPYGSKISTGDMGRLALRFSDGTTLVFGFNSSFEIPNWNRGSVAAPQRPSQIVLSQGRLYAMVRPVGLGAPFQVLTPAATAEVLGTEFGLEVGREAGGTAKWKATLQVKEGRVSFFNEFGRETATAMTESVAIEGSKPTEPKRLSILRLIQGSAYRTSAAGGDSSVVFHLLIDGTTRLTSQSALYRLAVPGGSLWLEGESVPEGVRVLYMWPHSPARRAGIEREDLIVAMNGEPTRSMVDVRRIAWRSLNRRVSVSLLRNGTRHVVGVFPITDGQPLPTWDANVANSVRNQTDLGLWRSRAEGIEELTRELLANPTCAGWINLGNLCEIGDDMVGAIRAFQQAIRLEPQSALAHQNLAIALKKIGNLPRAIEEASAATRLAPYWAWAHLEYSDVLLAAGDFEGSLEENRVAQRLLPGAGTVLHGEAKILQRLGRVQEALQVAHRATEVDPFHSSPWQFLSQYHYQNGPLKDAETYGRRAIEANPNDGNSRQVLAGALHRMGRTQEALAEVEEGLRRDENHPYLWQRKGLIFSDLGKLKEALEAHQNAVKNDPRNTSFLTNLAFVLEDLGQTPEAEKTYKQAIEVGPTNRLAYMNLANLYHREGNLKLAEVWFRRLYVMAPDFAMGMRGFGHVLAQTGRHEEAVEVLKKSLTLEPRDPETHWRLGAALSDMGKPEEGEPYLRKSVEMNPKDPFAQVNLARCLVSQRKFDDAAKFVAEFEKLTADDPNGPYTAAGIYQQMGRMEEAEAAYLRSLKIDPKFSNSMNSLGLLRQRNGQLKEAEDLFRQAIQARPNNVEARSNLGELLEKTGRFPEAVAEFRALLKIAPNDAYSLNWLAWEFAERRESLPEALQLAKKATALEPRNANYFDTLGFVHFQRSELPQAIAAYKKSIALYGPRSAAADVWASLANVYKKQGHPDEAAKALARAAELQPKNPGRWLDLGNGLSQAGSAKEAEDAFKKALALAPESAQVHLNYGIHLRKAEKHPEAENSFRKALALAPKNPFCSINLAEMLKDLKRYDEAIQVYRDFLKLDHGNGMVLNNLASIFALTGKNLDEALDLAKRAVAESPSRPNRAALVGEVQRLRGDLADAEFWLRKALDLYKDSAEAAETWAELGLVYEARSDRAKALQHFRKALTLDPKQQQALDGIKRLGG